MCLRQMVLIFPSRCVLNYAQAGFITEMLLFRLRLFDQAEQQLREMADDDEGRGQRRAAVVLHYQVVPLELPEDVRVALHYLKGVAGGRRQCILKTSLHF